MKNSDKDMFQCHFVHHHTGWPLPISLPETVSVMCHTFLKLTDTSAGMRSELNIWSIWNMYLMALWKWWQSVHA